MWTVCTTDDIAYFHDQKAVVSVYLSDGFNHDEIQWVLNAWNGFNERAGHRWHLLIPSKVETHVLNQRLDASEYDVRLAERIRERNQIKKSALPVLAFENYSATGSPSYFSLCGKSHEEVVDLLRKITDVIVEEEKDERSSPNEFRRSVAARIRILSNQDTARRWLYRSLAAGASLIGVASGMKTFI